MGCKSKCPFTIVLFFIRFNRNIMGCKWDMVEDDGESKEDLIGT